MDPSLYDGHKVIFDELMPVEVKLLDDDEGVIEELRIRVLILGDERQPMNIKIEITSESDIFFFYQNTTNEEKFRVIQEQQKLSLDYHDFTGMVLKILTTYNEERKAYLEFFQDTEYRRVEMLKIDLEECDDDIIKNHITYRLSATKQKTIMMQERVKDIMAIVEEKNPILMQEIYKVSPSIYSRQ
ncbi:UNKNOWN [Stylonychia lemnae]|uniref:Spindle assembly abnormal protein 6 N-terminal domain-containing protein n=1 Tax=Stylonychia lemnae TaxID=5949 RepID=A0A077ZWV7_STYLE|nr:UNKNOWN [Stylonychia lemnae]|eukprot:CDW72981.1 UNKNOWN [Stylonychia lemnae]